MGPGNKEIVDKRMGTDQRERKDPFWNNQDESRALWETTTTRREKSGKLQRERFDQRCRRGLRSRPNTAFGKLLSDFLCSLITTGQHPQHSSLLLSASWDSSASD